MGCSTAPSVVDSTVSEEESDTGRRVISRSRRRNWSLRSALCLALIWFLSTVMAVLVILGSEGPLKLGNLSFDMKWHGTF